VDFQLYFPTIQFWTDLLTPFRILKFSLEHLFPGKCVICCHLGFFRHVFYQVFHIKAPCKPIALTPMRKNVIKMREKDQNQTKIFRKTQCVGNQNENCLSIHCHICMNIRKKGTKKNEQDQDQDMTMTKKIIFGKRRYLFWLFFFTWGVSAACYLYTKLLQKI
jgi:hypothetical protein